MNQHAKPVKTAKLFRNGRSQAVRLPAEFRFEGDEVEIRRDELTGEVILSKIAKRTGSLARFFELRDAIPPEELEGFMEDREQEGQVRDDPFE
ncbi:MAG: AbrB/MazE/SpoVT family DNA-binding domain-containing protein [Mesorhizobium sp.]|nr:AbrB/MazE/SpoVT family DNA-binding domain-containing protein [Mesorhizobium sp.]MCO5162350.1 AbrB/MazE/SpoVT family DNA-binding domain-containing protein [Mesorhizobium sp.]